MYATGSERDSSDGGLDTDSVTDSVHSGSQAPPTRNAASVLHRLYNILDRRSQVSKVTVFSLNVLKSYLAKE
jgi:hypothetical protein